MPARERSRKKIVVIGGGTGVFTVLSGLKEYFSDLTAIVTMADEGGSTGILREDFGVLPPGDIRRALVALSRTDNRVLSQLFNYRFREGHGLKGHSFGNLMLTALERLTGSFEAAVGEAAKILSVEGKVVPVTLDCTHLCAELENGAVIRGENNIDIPKHDGNLKIRKLWLEPKARLNPAAGQAIREADLVIIGPGDLFTSILPNVAVAGMVSALRRTRAKKLYLVNIMTKFGETNGYRASDFIRTMADQLGPGVITWAAAAGKKPGHRRLAPYLREKAAWTEIDRENIPAGVELLVADLVRPRGFLRHDPEKVARLVRGLI